MTSVMSPAKSRMCAGAQQEHGFNLDIATGESCDIYPFGGQLSREQRADAVGCDGTHDARALGTHAAGDVSSSQRVTTSPSSRPASDMESPRTWHMAGRFGSQMSSSSTDRSSNLVARGPRHAGPRGDQNRVGDEPLARRNTAILTGEIARVVEWGDHFEHGAGRAHVE